jgi:hypothetical protein
MAVFWAQLVAAGVGAQSDWKKQWEATLLPPKNVIDRFSWTW